MTITADEAAALIEISLVQPVSPSFREQYEADESGTQDASIAVHRWLSETRIWLEQAVGLYALYQFPVVWEPLRVYPVVGFVDIATNTFQMTTRIEPDNFIPFRLNAETKLQDGQLADKALVDLARLESRGLHFPLVLLQRALWQRNVQLRFLETFLLLDYLTGQSTIVDPDRAQRMDLFNVIEEFVRRDHPEHVERQRLTLYLTQLDVPHDERRLRHMLKIRNDLVHARPVDANVLAEVELEARSLARQAMRRELESKGITFSSILPLNTLEMPAA